MQTEQIKAMIVAALPNAEVDVKLEGNHCAVRVVSEAFEGLRAVKRQQMVYAGLNELIANGSIHAVNIQALTPAEHSA